MNETVKLIWVFLASPGDLQDERRLVNEAVEEINKSIASNLGFRVELKAWEETLTASGRSQAIINQELDRCELFIGIMWKKWGTPPSIDGHYSSGFEEEFERSSLRYKETGYPEMAMYFKDIGSQLTINAGEDLTKLGEDIDKVNEFRESLISKKEVHFETFDDPNKFQVRVRLKITDYLFKLNSIDEVSQEEKQAKTIDIVDSVESTTNTELVKSPFSTEGYNFLKDFLSKTQAMDNTDNVSTFEIARFRLLSTIISNTGNDNPNLGVHDANVIYTNRYVNFSDRETLGLIDCALINFKQENVPLWYWLKSHSKSTEEDMLSVCSIISPTEVISVGALEAMNLIGSTLPINDVFVDRKYFISRWLADKSSDVLKVAALLYIKNYGVNEDLPLIQAELDHAYSQTARVSLEAILSIQLRNNKEEALNSVFNNQFDSFDEELLDKVLVIPSELNNEVLNFGLKHRNKKVRLASFRRLRDKEKINIDELKKLKNDACSKIRREAVELWEEIIQPLSESEVKSIIVTSKSGYGMSILSSGLTETDGKEDYEEYLFSKYLKMSESELLIIVDDHPIFDEAPYFALCSRYFKNNSTELRRNIDDEFKIKFKKYIDYIKSIGATEKSIKKLYDLEGYLRKSLMRKGMDILCLNGNANDVDLVRRSMRSKYIKSSFEEIEYMRKNGGWDDIPYILKLERGHAARNSLSILSADTTWDTSIAKAIYKIGSNRLEDLFNIEMSNSILVELIKICASTKFKKIEDELLYFFLNNEDDKIRKSAALKSIRSFTKTRLKKVLNSYVDSDKYRYYNVIFWLDFGVSMPKSIINNAVKINAIK